MPDIRILLKQYEGKQFVFLTFRDDKGKPVKLDNMNWIEKVGRKKFTFKPTIIDIWEAPIDRVVAVEPLA